MCLDACLIWKNCNCRRIIWSYLKNAFILRSKIMAWGCTITLGDCVARVFLWDYRRKLFRIKHFIFIITYGCITLEICMFVCFYYIIFINLTPLFDRKAKICATSLFVLKCSICFMAWVWCFVFSTSMCKSSMCPTMFVGCKLFTISLHSVRCITSWSILYWGWMF